MTRPTACRLPMPPGPPQEVIAGASRAWRHCRERDAVERTARICDCVIDIVAALFNVSGRELRQPGRTCTSVSRVRQIAMYVTHVAMGLPMREVGRGFGRDRTTVLHACHLIEDMRDDSEFDAIVGMCERVAVAALRGERPA